ncbi:MAG: OadG family protein [Firmicutes bacterium]|nr:OadG family protein [Bacillota bacterium]
MEKIFLGLEVMIIGFCITMLFLSFLYLILVGFSHLNRILPATVRTKTTKQLNACPTQAAAEKTSPTELIAVISASISSYLHKSPQEIAVISVLPQRTTLRSEWVAAGRNNLLAKGHYHFLRRKERKS